MRLLSNSNTWESRLTRDGQGYDAIFLPYGKSPLKIGKETSEKANRLLKRIAPAAVIEISMDGSQAGVPEIVHDFIERSLSIELGG